MRILLLGSNGQLGRSFIEDGALAQRGELITASRCGVRYDGEHIEKADLAQPATLSALLDRIQPDLIVNTAAYTAVDRAEQEEALAHRINGQAVGILGHWASRHKARVIHYSTDYVFNGETRTPYPVDAPTAPLSAYGRSKLAGEVALRASGAAHFIFRTAWVYAPHGHNFLQTMLRLGTGHERLRVVTDQFGAPTSTTMIVAATLAALDSWQTYPTPQRKVLEGTHHVTARGYVHWHGLAKAIFKGAVKRSLLARMPQLETITSAAYPTPAQRPPWSVLDNSSFASYFNHTLPTWESALDEVLDVLPRAHA